MLKVRQHFDRSQIVDVRSAVRAALSQCPALTEIRKGQRVAITAGSRGISNIVEVLQTIIEAVKENEAEPFIIPAMGSHGGATGKGQFPCPSTT